MEQLVILVIIGLISLVNWILQRAAERREAAKAEAEIRRQQEEFKRSGGRLEPPPPPARPAPPAPPPLAPAKDPLRELMEALGLPDEEPPPHRSPRQAPPPLPEPNEEFASMEEVMEVPPPVLTAPPSRPAPVVTAPRWEATPPAPVATVAMVTAEKFQVHGPSRETSGEARPAALRSLLREPEGRRQAVLLAEILGTPRGLLPAAAWPGSADR